MQHAVAESISVTLAALFALGGGLQLCYIGPLRRACLRWGFPPRLSRVTGALELLSAGLLALPSTRPGGVALAAAVNFYIVVLLLNSRAYLMALPGIGVAAALLVTLFQWA